MTLSEAAYIFTCVLGLEGLVSILGWADRRHRIRRIRRMAESLIVATTGAKGVEDRVARWLDRLNLAENWHHVVYSPYRKGHQSPGRIISEVEREMALLCHRLGVNTHDQPQPRWPSSAVIWAVSILIVASGLIMGIDPFGLALIALLGIIYGALTPWLVSAS